MSRLFARAVDGERAVGNIPGSKGGKVSLIGALNRIGASCFNDCAGKYKY
ncbi:MAG: hypothetical protein RMY34_36720 [Aulosira sp. DedQUE10]|nr:hypothetical protein [Aulosira sp. DedQUE10]